MRTVRSIVIPSTLVVMGAALGLWGLLSMWAEATTLPVVGAVVTPGSFPVIAIAAGVLCAIAGLVCTMFDDPGEDIESAKREHRARPRSPRAGALADAASPAAAAAALADPSSDDAPVLPLRDDRGGRGGRLAA